MKIPSFSQTQTVAAATLLFFLISVSLVYFTTTMLDTDLAELLTKANPVSVGNIADDIADDIEQSILSRTRTLQDVASMLPVDKINDRAAMSSFLARQKEARELFPIGLIIIGRDGFGIADYPHIQDRDTADFRNRESFKEVISSGMSAIGKAHVGNHSRIPLVSISVPIRSKKGELLGILRGAVALTDPDVFDQTYERLGKPIEYLVVSVKDHMIVAATDSSQLLRPLPAPGIDKLFDRYMSGYDGSGYTRNLYGREEFISARHILDGKWIVIGELPK